MIEQWQELKETITEMRDNDGTGTQQEVCKFLVNYMGVLEKQMQEPNYNSINPELNGDMISRQEVFKIIEDIRDCVSVTGYWALLERLKKIPPVNPTKTGHWIVHEKPHGIRYLECPYCNIWYLNEHLIRNSYCPNCGAKMESEK